MQLNLIYKKLYSHFGPQGWWPAESPFEVMVGAILTQNTNWQNVKKAIGNLKKNSLLNPKKLYNISTKDLGLFIRPAGYYNIKAKRLKEFLKFYFDAWKGSIKETSLFKTEELRKSLLSVKGIGPETADSILLYALNRPVFVVDAYTKRIFSKHGLIKENAAYDEVQSLFMLNLKKNVKMFNEYHALLVKLGKEYCLKRKAKCEICPLHSRNCFHNGLA
ncbi:MAG: endonuclease III domain-containing protein [Candidatus Omnitrophota bacterium]|nr:endonuclease III domain-containing protein [Candidatus Omnitrophota bacterium]